MKELLVGRIIKYILVVAFLIFIIHFLKSGKIVVKKSKHNIGQARKISDIFMQELAKNNTDNAFEYFYPPAKQDGKKSEFKESINSAKEELGLIKEIVFLSSYPQTNGPYIGLYYKAIHENIRGVDYYLLLIKEERGYSIFQFVFGISGRFYPDFSFKNEVKSKPVIIYQLK